jgi:hypothetical protein
MQLIWYLPSLVIGLTVGLSSGYWQLALVSVVMVTLMGGVALYRNRYPQFDEKSQIMISVGQVAIDSRILPRFQFLWKKQWHELLLVKFRAQGAPDYFNAVLEKKYQLGKFVEGDGELLMWLGASVREDLYLDLSKDGPHLIVVGPTGSGKSELLKLMVQSLLEVGVCELALFDFKGGATLEQFSKSSVGFATDLDSKAQAKLWALVSSELETRERVFAEQLVSSIEQYRKQGFELKPLVVVIDEFAAALASGALAQVCIESVCARGRSLGVHLIAATQSLTGVPRAMLTNLRARIAMKSSDPIDLVQLGINPSKVSVAQVPGFSGAVLVSANLPATDFFFPLGFRLEPKPVASKEAGEPPPPARSQLLRQMYSSPEPATDQPAEPSSSHDSQLLSRMEGLR